MLPFDEARQRVLNGVSPLPSERVSLRSASGRILREALSSPHALPRVPLSAMDGYALSTGALGDGSGPWILPVSAESRAGLPSSSRLTGGSVVRIFTGAELPPGADAVVIQENVARRGNSIQFSERPRPWQHVRRAGSDLQPGQVVLESGLVLSPYSLSVAASLECEELLVSSSPKVAILSTGDELRTPGSPHRPGTIPESNSVALAALAESVGGVVDVTLRAGDSLSAITEAIDTMLNRVNLLVTVGGVSVGDHDLVRPALERAGVELDFWKVQMKPGKPLVFGRRGNTLVLGLPGNPVSAQLTFALFGLPLLRKLQGASACFPRPQTAILGAAITQSTGRLVFHRVMLDGDRAMPLLNQSSGAAHSLAVADALAMIPANVSHLDVGARVQVLRLKEL